MKQQSLGKWLSSLRVGQKIGLGYAFALGIAVSGTIAGFGIGNHYHKQAAAREDHTRSEVELLHRLQAGILQMRTHQQQLIPLLQHPEDFQNEYTHMLTHKAEIEQTLGELRVFLGRETAWVNDIHQTEIPKFLQTYNNVPDQYFQKIDNLVQVSHSYNLASSKDAEQFEDSLLDFTNSDLALKFDGMSDDLVGLISNSYNESRKAEEEFQHTSIIAQEIVAGSIALSVAMAVLLAILTSRAIARPIQTLTSVAQRSTEEANFDIQATIERDDEIGTLANAFNQLIHAVKQLLQQQKIANEQLETYSQTLESKVEERTQELNDKNIQLQQLLEELKRTQVQMVQNEKMSALGQMVAGVAHEINNPVNFIYGNLEHVQEYAYNLLDYVQLYQKHYSDPVPEIQAEAENLDIEFVQADLPKILSSMKIGTDRIRQIVLSLRNFSRMDEADFKAVDIHEGIDSTLLILQHRLKDKPERPAIQVVCDYGNLPLVECYPGQINQVFMNILANAIDALEEANSKRTYLEIQENPNQIVIQTSMIDSKWIGITISDNGTGMSESVQKRIFDPFFTTKSVGKGTGMGMPISYQIITEKHGGKLKCFSVSGEGTKFIMQLPIQQAHDVSSKSHISVA
ncbi:ATP-binding protein [Leptolyngbya sp. FACHB-16]|uniref:sensor histidine kinase n=1 Tax=unclassified Leptolyngbya TaxID=2650499 RepID=UPI00168690F8|nr:ATP-binding protein [Leptolyngbya sp. FACHB-16]MBD2153998.1 HAMP domain-containing protein [Leptolyngbya sp. FACHB-16]